jgi:hypothetical protein
MTNIKRRRIEAMSSTARYPNTFNSILAAIPACLLERLTAADLAAVVDFGRSQSVHGWSKGVGEVVG